MSVSFFLWKKGPAIELNVTNSILFDNYQMQSVRCAGRWPSAEFKPSASVDWALHVGVLILVSSKTQMIVWLDDWPFSSWHITISGLWNGRPRALQWSKSITWANKSSKKCDPFSANEPISHLFLLDQLQMYRLIEWKSNLITFSKFTLASSTPSHF